MSHVALIAPPCRMVLLVVGHDQEEDYGWHATYEVVAIRSILRDDGESIEDLIVMGEACLVTADETYCESCEMARVVACRWPTDEDDVRFAPIRDDLRDDLRDFLEHRAAEKS